jgi:MoaA/NifB/PqqE/SkfB family radical SAM enzyme
MSFETFKKMFDKFPKTLTQIAFGIGDIDANKDLWRMMAYCRENNVVPNITINGHHMTNEYYDLLARYCGAVAVSLYDDEDVCYDAVRELWAHGVKQVNIHCLLADETIDKCHHVLHMQKNDRRLANLNAVVFLWLKQRGERNTFHQVSYASYRTLVTEAIFNENNIGFDSCSAPNFLAVIKDVFPDAYKQYELVAESCESTLFSYYVNTHGRGYPCSFSEDGDGIDVVGCNDFVKDIWEHPVTSAFRDKVMHNTCGNGCRKCPVYDLYIGEN